MQLYIRKQIIIRISIECSLFDPHNRRAYSAFSGIFMLYQKGILSLLVNDATTKPDAHACFHATATGTLSHAKRKMSHGNVLRTIWLWHGIGISSVRFPIVRRNLHYARQRWKRDTAKRTKSISLQTYTHRQM